MAHVQLVSADSREATGAGTPADALGVCPSMSTSNPGVNQSGDVECPTCGRDDFKSRLGLKQHHAKVHGESLRGVEVHCENCGDAFRRSPSHVNDRNFCSYECRGAWQSENAVGEDAFRWEGGKQDSVCERCGEDFKHRRHQPGRFCSNECFHTHLSENAKPESPYYGPSWPSQRNAALDRDDHECVICGSNQMVDVHHIRPFRKFGVENHGQANKLDNLVCLCRQHHMKWEGIPLRPEVPGE